MNVTNQISFEQTRITDGFWAKKQKLNEEVTAKAVYDRFSDTHRFDALSCKPLSEHPDWEPHIFWDSDIAKWLEGVAYILTMHENEELRTLAEKAISDILNAQTQEGYFNSYYQVKEQENRFRIRNNHELYCAGHLMEAAVAHYKATGERYFLDAMCRYADYIYQIFVTEQSAEFVTCGHPEIELALVRLYDATGTEKYLELANFFVDQRGNNKKDAAIYDDEPRYAQDHLPLREQTTAEGHSVRAMYIYSAMADLAKKNADEALFMACKKIFENATQKRMYITGALGSTHIGEAFTFDYDLPNRTAYAETCASIAMTFFAQRMLALEPDAKYSDVIERDLYNGILSGWSLDGKSFFYENPLEIDPYLANRITATKTKEHLPIMERVEVFDCSCCPPNLVRFIASVGNFLYSEQEETLFVHQYMSAETKTEKGTIVQETNYPNDGVITITVPDGYRRAAVRIPGWCREFSLNLPYEMKNGYAYINISGETQIQLTLELEVRLYASNLQVQENAGKVAVGYGPIIYCIEEKDNGPLLKSIYLEKKPEFKREYCEVCGVQILKTRAKRLIPQDGLYYDAEDAMEEIPLTLIPYFAFANRGASEMIVWIHKLM